MPNEAQELSDWLDNIPLTIFHEYGWWYVRHYPCWTLPPSSYITVNPQ